MLILSRTAGQSIVVPGSGLNIRVLAVKGRKVILGFSAPPDTVIHREEVWLDTGTEVAGGPEVVLPLIEPFSPTAGPTEN